LLILRHNVPYTECGLGRLDAADESIKKLKTIMKI
jgi:hypothetical protein